MDVKTYRRKSKGKHSFRIRPTWHRFCISDHPSVCHRSSSGNIAKKHKNKLFAITAVPMGTGAEGVPALTLICTNSMRASLAACYTKQAAVLLARTGASDRTLLSLRAISRPHLWKVPQGEKDQDSWDVGPAVLIRTLPLFNKDHTFPEAAAAMARQSCKSKLDRSAGRAGGEK